VLVTLLWQTVVERHHPPQTGTLDLPHQGLDSVTVESSKDCHQDEKHDVVEKKRTFIFILDFIFPS